MSRKVAIVTGANKGIGFAIVKGLCEKFDGDVYLTSRDAGRGEAAVLELNGLGHTPLYHRLDISDEGSITQFRDHIEEKHGGIDVLVNNAGITFPPNTEESFASRAEKTTSVNYFGLVSICNILFPLLRPKARVVNVSSSSGHLARIPGKIIKETFGKGDLLEPELSNFVKQFVEAAKNGTHVAEGWGESIYVVSKVAVNALTFIQNREYGPKGISVNCVHPGYVATDMTQHLGPLTVDQGAVAPLHLALDAPEDLKGVYMWFDKQIVDWFGEAPKPS